MLQGERGEQGGKRARVYAQLEARLLESEAQFACARFTPQDFERDFFVRGRTLILEMCARLVYPYTTACTACALFDDYHTGEGRVHPTQTVNYTAVAAVMIAVKVTEDCTYARVSELLGTWAELTLSLSGLYVHRVLETELDMLTHLDYRLPRASLQIWLDVFIDKAALAQGYASHIFKRAIDWAVFCYTLTTTCHYPPSLIAALALYRYCPEFRARFAELSGYESGLLSTHYHSQDALVQFSCIPINDNLAYHRLQKLDFPKCYAIITNALWPKTLAP